MLKIDNAQVVQKIESYCRTWRIYIENLNTQEAFMGTAVMNANSDMQSTASSDDIEFGAVCAGQWTLSVYNPDNKKFIGNRFKLYFYLKDFGADPVRIADLRKFTNGELAMMTVDQIKELNDIMGGVKIPMGTFTCIRSKKNGDGTDITLCDALYFSDRVYTPVVKLPCQAKLIEDDICRQLGIVNGNNYARSSYINDKNRRKLYGAGKIRLKVKGFDFKINSIPDGATMRQVLSYIASAQGQFGFIDRDGKYLRKWYGAPVKTFDNNTIDTPTLSERPNKIIGLICHIDGSTDLTRGNTDTSAGRVLEFDNPFMTEILMNSLWHRILVSEFEWYTADIYHRLGDPRFDIGDVVKYIDNSGVEYNIPVTGLAYSFDGGLSAQIKSVGIDIEEQIGG